MDSDYTRTKPEHGWSVIESCAYNAKQLVLVPDYSASSFPFCA